MKLKAVFPLLVAVALLCAGCDSGGEADEQDLPLDQAILKHWVTGVDYDPGQHTQNLDLSADGTMRFWIYDARAGTEVDSVTGTWVLNGSVIHIVTANGGTTDLVVNVVDGQFTLADETGHTWTMTRAP